MIRRLVDPTRTTSDIIMDIRAQKITASVRLGGSRDAEGLIMNAAYTILCDGERDTIDLCDVQLTIRKAKAEAVRVMLERGVTGKLYARQALVRDMKTMSDEVWVPVDVG